MCMQTIVHCENKVLDIYITTQSRNVHPSVFAATMQVFTTLCHLPRPAWMLAEAEANLE